MQMQFSSATPPVKMCLEHSSECDKHEIINMISAEYVQSKAEHILIVFHQRQGEDLVHHHLVLPRLPQLFQLFFQLFCPGKAVDEVEPVPLHPADGAARAAEQFSVAVVQVGQVALQLLFGGGRTAPPCGKAPGLRSARAPP